MSATRKQSASRWSSACWNEPELAASLAAVPQHEINSSEAERWKRENREAIQTLNRIVEEHGLFSDDHRVF